MVHISKKKKLQLRVSKGNRELKRKKDQKTPRAFDMAPTAAKKERVSVEYRGKFGPRRK